MSVNHTESNQQEMYGEEHRYINGAGYHATIPYGFDGTNAYPVNTDTIVEALYDALVRLQPYQNALPYARDTADQMRTVVSSGSINATQYWGNVGTEPVYYGTGGPNSVDAREALELQSQTNFNLIRNGRWVIT